MAADLALGEVEDQPPAADVGVRELELVADERADRLGLRRIEHRVDAADHRSSHVRLGTFSLDCSRYDTRHAMPVKNRKKLRQEYARCGHALQVLLACSILACAAGCSADSLVMGENRQT